MLHLDAASTFGLRRDDLIVKDGDMFAVEDRLADYERWRTERGTCWRRVCAEPPRADRDAWAAEAARTGIDEAIAAAADDPGHFSCPAPKDARADRVSARSSTPCSPRFRSMRMKR